MNTAKYRWPALALPALVVVFAAETLLFFGWIPDDAFISFRYAANLAEGVGPVFNAGERVEGVSNPLWTLLLGAFAAAGLDPAAAAVAASLVCALAAVVLSWKLFETVLVSDPAGAERRRFPGLRTVLALGLVVSFPAVFYATSGLETHAELLFLLIGTVLHLDAHRRGDGRRFGRSQAAFLVVALIRPEGIVFLLVGAAFIAARPRGASGPPRSWPAIVIPIAVFALSVLARYSYYGAWLPNTYLAKPGASFAYPDPLWRGVVYLVRFFMVSGLVLMLPFCIIAFFDTARRYACGLLAAVVAAQIGFIVFVGGDVLRFDRFTVPFTPFLLALALVGFVRLDGLARIRSRRLSLAGAAFCVVLMTGLNGGRVYLAERKFCLHDWMHARVHRRVGAYLRAALPPDASVVTNEVGAIAYTSGLRVHDMIGLTDATVGGLLYESYRRHGVSGSDFSVPRIAAYLLAKAPDCVLLPAYREIDPYESRAPHGGMHPIWEGLYRHPDLAAHYRCTFRLRIHDDKFWYFYFRRDGGADRGISAPEPDRCMDVRTFAAGER